MRAPITRWLPAIPALAMALGLLRWLTQGTGNVYSKADARLYVPDQALGWRKTSEGFVWLGLDVIAVCAALAVVGIVGYLWLQKRGKLGLWLTSAAQLIGTLTIAIPLTAFVSGMPDGDAKETRPGLGIEAPVDGIKASLKGLPSGRYEVVPHHDAGIAAVLKAGGEKFEARFAGGLSGSWTADPSDLTQPMQAEVTVESGSVETGIDLRDTHAKDELNPAKHPIIRFRLTKVLASQAGQAGAVEFSAQGEVELVGRKHEVSPTGTLQALDPDSKRALGLKGGTFLLVQASFSLNLKHTAIGNDGTFDDDVIPLTATLILKHTEN